MLEANFSFSYRNFEVLKDIVFRLEEGEMLFVLGPNGSGKTTMLKCLNRILKPKGSILIEKINLNNLKLEEIAKLFGYVPQRGEVSFLTVFDAILLGRRPYIKWEVGEEDVKIVEEVIKLFKLEKLALRKLNELSGGELQLVLLARAFAQQPRYLLLDEPTNNLDVKNQIEVMRIVKKAVKEKNVSAIVTVHDLNLALNYAEKILVLKDGKIHTFGSVEALNEDVIREVYGINVEILKYNGRRIIVPEI
ncbi:MAG: ABC transporter ATP-binding protein [Archaeoglobaceae archaeon]|nr:ABC transporter ATP-binding protein [Archaeoglobaceae archaeon]MCX8152753.1 ABC transporter ATP-binding protein [Archaeoglobaceae archaeon]MDW8013460.1 ABC transporter ATP-binding protein [Archaeoglobaceae archaeon]